MTDLISRQAAIDDFNGVKVDEENCTEYDIGFNDGVDLAISKLSVLPSAQPERKTAEWVYGEKDGADGWFCSECGFHVPWYYDYYGLDNIDFIRDYHTCPCCDSKMLKYTGMKEEEQ